LKLDKQGRVHIDDFLVGLILADCTLAEPRAKCIKEIQNKFMNLVDQTVDYNEVAKHLD